MAYPIINITNPIANEVKNINDNLNIEGQISSSDGHNINYKIEIHDADGNVLQTLKEEVGFQSTPVTINESYIIDEQILNNKIVITAWDDFNTIQVTEDITMNDDGTLESGKQWSATIDLSKYLSVDKIEVLS